MDDCYALQATTAQDSVVFFLYHQLNNGLVRLAGDDCTAKTDARVVRQDEAVIFPLAIDTAATPSWLPQDDWLINPDADTFYVVASSNSRAARALAQHFAQLPQRCGYSLRPGLEGGDLRRWFRDLDAIAGRWHSEIDWHSVRVKTVY